MRPAPRQVRLAEGSDILGHSDGFTRILDISRSYSAPEAADAIHRKVMRFMSYRTSDRSIDEYTAEYALLRARAESKLELGAGFPDQFASILRMSNTGLSRHETSLIWRVDANV